MKDQDFCTTLMSLEQPWTCFGLPLNINRITLQRGFALFLFYTFFNYEEYRMHVFVLGAVTLFAIRNPDITIERVNI